MCEDLVARRLRLVQYIVSDVHARMLQRMQRFFPECVHRQRQVHHVRNALTKVSSPAMREQVFEHFRRVWRNTTRAEADERARAKKIGAVDSPPNSIEHDHVAVRRRPHVVSVFPNELSFLRLASSLASERNEQCMVRRYVTAQKYLKQPLVNITA